MAQAESGRFFSFSSLFGGRGVPRGEDSRLVNIQPVPLEPELPLEPVLEDNIGLVVSTDGASLHLVEGSGNEDRRPHIETWRNLKRRFVYYGAGAYPDGTAFNAGKRLIVERDVDELVEGRLRRMRVSEQVMDEFEVPWCDATVNAMFEGKDKPLVVVERGFGLGLMADRINWQMRSRGGTHIIIELNEEIYEDAQKWKKRKDDEMTKRPGQKVEIEIIHGDADEVLIQRFGERTIDLLFSDTHQLREEERGVNDLLALGAVVERLKSDGRFSFCAFHRDNQTGNLDSQQYRLITRHFDKHTVLGVDLVPPPDSSYLQGPRKRVPAVVCYEPLLAERAA